MNDEKESLNRIFSITSTAFCDGEPIPLRCSARGEDVSPGFKLKNMDSKAKSVVITMDDMSHPIFKIYNHWCIWNIPVQEEIPEGIPRGKTVPSLGGAVQGIGYGRHRYRGPKPPFKSIHTYQFTVYTLDCTLNLPSHCGEKELLNRMDGHILQRAMLSGTFQNP